MDTKAKDNVSTDISRARFKPLQLDILGRVLFPCPNFKKWPFEEPRLLSQHFPHPPLRWPVVNAGCSCGLYISILMLSSHMLLLIRLNPQKQQHLAAGTHQPTHAHCTCHRYPRQSRYQWREQPLHLLCLLPESTQLNKKIFPFSLKKSLCVQDKVARTLSLILS